MNIAEGETRLRGKPLLDEILVEMKGMDKITYIMQEELSGGVDNHGEFGSRRAVD